MSGDDCWDFRQSSLRDFIKRSWAPLIQYRITTLMQKRPHPEHDLSKSNSDSLDGKDQAIVKDAANLMHIWASTKKTLEWVETLYLESRVSETYSTLLQILHDNLCVPVQDETELKRLFHQSVAILSEFFENNESTKFIRKGLNEWNLLDISEELKHRPHKWRVEFLRHMQPKPRCENGIILNEVSHELSVEEVRGSSQADDEIEIVEAYQSKVSIEGSKDYKNEMQGGFQLMMAHMTRKLMSSKLCQNEMEAQKKAFDKIKSLEAAGFNYRNLLRFYYKEKQRLENDNRVHELKPILFKTIASKNRGMASMEVSRTVDLVDSFFQKRQRHCNL